MPGGQGYNIFGFIEFSTVAEAEAASQTEIDIHGQRIRVEPKEYSARRHTRLQPFGPTPPAQRSRTIAWGPSANVYQSPGMPYGFQPIYIQQPPGAFATYYQGQPWTTTPPSSGIRRRATAPGEYLYGSPPQAGAQYVPIEHAAYGPIPSGSWRSNEAEGHEHSQRRYR